MKKRDFGEDFAVSDLHPGPFSITDRIRSFRHATDGIALMLRSQHNAWLHAVASVTVLVFGIICHLSARGFCWLVIAIMAVWTAEALNTALEFLADVASPEFHPLAKKAKDVAAGAVLISAAGSVVIALLIFGPHIIKCLHMRG
jgi:diacylglycerol kinase (ATP)